MTNNVAKKPAKTVVVDKRDAKINELKKVIKKQTKEIEQLKAKLSWQKKLDPESLMELREIATKFVGKAASLLDVDVYEAVEAEEGEYDEDNW